MGHGLQQICFILVATLVIACATRPAIESCSVEVANENMSAVIVFSDSDQGKIRHYFNVEYLF